MQLTQKYQMASGALKNGNITTPITNGRLRGDQITFTRRGHDLHRPRRGQHDDRNDIDGRGLARDAVLTITAERGE